MNATPYKRQIAYCFSFSFTLSLSLTFVMSVCLFVCLFVCIGNRTKTKANDHRHQRLYSALTKRINNQFTRNVDNPNYTHTWPIIIYFVYLEHTYITFVGGCKRARARFWRLGLIYPFNAHINVCQISAVHSIFFNQ